MGPTAPTQTKTQAKNQGPFLRTKAANAVAIIAVTLAFGLHLLLFRLQIIKFVEIPFLDGIVAIILQSMLVDSLLYMLFSLLIFQGSLLLNGSGVKQRLLTKDRLKFLALIYICGEGVLVTLGFTFIIFIAATYGNGPF